MGPRPFIWLQFATPLARLNLSKPPKIKAIFSLKNPRGRQIMSPLLLQPLLKTNGGMSLICIGQWGVTWDHPYQATGWPGPGKKIPVRDSQIFIRCPKSIESPDLWEAYYPINCHFMPYLNKVNYLHPIAIEWSKQWEKKGQQGPIKACV